MVMHNSTTPNITSTSSFETIDAGSIGQRENCEHAGQVQLAAMTISNSGEPLLHVFESVLNHSVVVTLRIVFEVSFADESSRF
jgi:hypothetical protein